MKDAGGGYADLFRLWRGTLLRLAGCGALIWASILGNYVIPINLFSAAALAAFLSVLLTYELEIRGIRPFCIVGTMIVMNAAILGSYGVSVLLRPPEPSGALRPAGEETPATACPQKAGRDDLVMLFGTNRVVGRGAGPFMPFTVDNCPGFSLRRRGGGLMLDMVGYSWTDDVSFMVRGNVYRAIDGLQLHPFRPDASTFVLLNRFDQEVIYVRYLNRNTVRIRGRLLCADSPQALIRDNAVYVGGVRIGGVYFGLGQGPAHRCAEIDAQHPDGIAIGERR